MAMQNKNTFLISFYAFLYLTFLLTTESTNLGLKILYDNGVEVEKLNELTPTQVQNQPKIEWDGYKSGSYYTLIMYDPDAPSRLNPRAAPFLHWLLVNIPGGDLTRGQVLAEYIGSGPPKGTGLHRYIFALYQQPNIITDEVLFATKFSRNGRANFNIPEFVTKHNLGEVVASNIYQAQWDDYVPVLQEQLSKGQ